MFKSNVDQVGDYLPEVMQVQQQTSVHKYLRISDLCKKLALLLRAHADKVAQFVQLVRLQGVVPPVPEKREPICSAF